MTDLDDQKLYERLDPTGMRHRIASMPEQCRSGWVQSSVFSLPDDYRGLNRVQVLGMGGSAVSGELLSGLQDYDGSTPVQVHRDYGHDGLVDDRTFLVASSCSGNTAETLDAFEKSWAPGVKALGCTKGGKLAISCRAKGVPIFPIGIDGEPRTTIGYSLFGLIGILQNLGLSGDRTADVTEAIEAMELLGKEIEPEVPTKSNLAKQMAIEACEKVVVIYGARHLSGVARRWKTQLAENAKAWAFSEPLPEANHNSLEGIRFPLNSAEGIYIVVLQSNLDDPRIYLRDHTIQLLREEGFQCQTFQPRGKSLLAQILTAVLFGDYVSYYLAMQNGVDPSPNPMLDRHKERLAAS